MEVVEKRGRGTEVTERRRDKYGVHLVREGRRYRGRGRKPKDRVAATRPGVSLQAKVFFQVWFQGFGRRVLAKTNTFPTSLVILKFPRLERIPSSEICAGPTLVITYVSVNQMNILETSLHMKLFFFFFIYSSLSQGWEWKMGEYRDIALPGLPLDKYYDDLENGFYWRISKCCLGLMFILLQATALSLFLHCRTS